jgi:hypothetical protein
VPRPGVDYSGYGEYEPRPDDGEPRAEPALRAADPPDWLPGIDELTGAGRQRAPGEVQAAVMHQMGLADAPPRSARDLPDVRGLADHLGLA